VRDLGAGQLNPDCADSRPCQRNSTAPGQTVESVRHEQEPAVGDRDLASYLQPALEQIGSALKEHSLAWQQVRRRKSDTYTRQ